MGIPKFYRWLSERYPLINQPIASTHVPTIDNLYLDMNGIIHNCTHGNDPNVKLTEEEMILKIFMYVERLFQIIQPQKLLFAAIDGCAPRAKMNQQRGRRFKAAKEAAEVAAKKAREDAEAVSAIEAFDSNCITPGTPFMGRLANHLRFFFRKKISEDPAWQKPVVIFSGHDVPGEGEHKIMEHMRWAQKQPNYAPNQRHCMYGLDADLIMLALVTHEPHFCLLREVVSFSGGNRGQATRETLANPKKENFILFQIGLLRDYMELEFASQDLGFTFDIERVIDDFVLFCMLIGNDFLPTLPTLDVNEGALNTIFDIYKQQLPRMGGYLVQNGQLQHSRLELILLELGKLELEILEQRAKDAQYLSNKRGKEKRGRQDGGSAMASELDGNDPLNTFAALEEEEESAAPVVVAEPTMMSVEARQMFLAGQGNSGLQLWKDRYYVEKLRIDPKDPLEVRRAVEAYVAGLHWVLEYYYRGVVSWDWFYPFHYSPIISDMTNLHEVCPRFDRGEPFTPYQQLLAVLPAASHKLLPKPYQRLMVDPFSPIQKFYPLNFTLDSEGKRQDWEAVVVLDFIDVPLLRMAEREVGAEQLTAEEILRNKFGPILQFQYDAESTESMFCTSTLPKTVASISRSKSQCTAVSPHSDLPEGEQGFLPRLVPGTVVGPGAPAGFPTLKTLEVRPELKMAGVNVLGQPSRKESLILTVVGRQAEVASATAQQLAGGLIGHRLWIKWPYMQEAKVQAVSDAICEVGTELAVKAYNKEEAENWRREASLLGQTLRGKSGVDVGTSNVLLHVLPCEGLVRQLDNTVEKQFAKKAILHPIQVTLKVNHSPDPRLDPQSMMHEMEPWLKEGAKAFFISKAHYGCIATIGPVSVRKNGMTSPADGNLTVWVHPAPPAAVTAVQTAKRLLSSFKVNYQPSYQIARSLGITPRCLSLLTGSVQFRVDGKRFDLGLCVKDPQKGLCVPDYAQPQPDGQGWLYSSSLMQTLQRFKANFLWIFQAIDRGNERGDIECSSIFKGQSTEQQLTEVKRAQQWLKAQPLSRRVLVKTSSVVASEQAIRALQSALPPALSRDSSPMEIENVPPTFLLPPNNAGSVPSVLSGGGSSLGDRVAFLGCNGPAPLGARGTVVGVHDDDFEVLFDAPFLGGNDLQGRCVGDYGAVCSAEDLLNLTNPKPATQALSGGLGKKTGKMPPKNVQPPPGFGTATDSKESPSEAVQPGNKPSAPKPPVSTWVGQRRISEGNIASPAGGVPQEIDPKKPNAPWASKTSKERQVRRVVDPPHAGTEGAKGFSMGRGRSLSAPAAVAPGIEASLQGIQTEGEKPAKEKVHPLLKALQGKQPNEEQINQNHKVHRGLGVAKEILRLSQQNLAAMDISSPTDEQQASDSNSGVLCQPVDNGKLLAPPMHVQPSGAENGTKVKPDAQEMAQAVPASMLPGATFLSMLQGKSQQNFFQQQQLADAAQQSTKQPAPKRIPKWFEQGPIPLAPQTSYPQAEATIQPGGPQQGRNGNSQSPFRGDTRQAAIDPSGLPPRMQGLAYATAAKPAIQSSAVSSAEALAFWSGLGSSQPGEKQPMSVDAKPVSSTGGGAALLKMLQKPTKASVPGSVPSHANNSASQLGTLHRSQPEVRNPVRTSLAPADQPLPIQPAVGLAGTRGQAQAMQAQPPPAQTQPSQAQLPPDASDALWPSPLDADSASKPPAHQQLPRWFRSQVPGSADVISTNRPQLTAPSNSDIRQAAQSATRDLPMSDHSKQPGQAAHGESQGAGAQRLLAMLQRGVLPLGPNQVPTGVAAIDSPLPSTDAESPLGGPAGVQHPQVEVRQTWAQPSSRTSGQLTQSRTATYPVGPDVPPPKDETQLDQGNLEIAMQLDTAIRDISSDRPNGLSLQTASGGLAAFWTSLQQEHLRK